MTPPETIVSALIGHRDVGTGSLCLASLAKNSREPVRFQIHEDGSLTDNDREHLFNELPLHTIISRRQADAIVNERLSHYPYCARFRRQYVYGLKIFDTTFLAPGEDLAYCDTDIYFLRPFYNLFSWPDEQTGCIFMQDYQNAYAFRPWHLAKQSQFTLPARMNAGFFFFRRRHFDLDAIEWLLKRYETLFAARYHWIEQTCWALLAMKCQGRFWSENQVRVIRGEACLTGDLVAAHLVQPVRGLLPTAVARSRPGVEPVQILTEPMQPLSALSLLKEQAQQFLQRKLGRAT